MSAKMSVKADQGSVKRSESSDTSNVMDKQSDRKNAGPVGVLPTQPPKELWKMYGITEVPLSKREGDLKSTDVDASEDVNFIDFANNSIKTIAGLERVPQLYRLDLSSNELKSCAGIENACNLKFLNLASNHLSDATGVAGLGLESLDISNNEFKNLNSLSGSSQMIFLQAANNKIADISGIEGLKKLKWVCLENNELSDVGVLLNCKDMIHLNLCNNRIKKADSLCLLAETCLNLKSVNLRDNYLNKMQVTAIKNAFFVSNKGCYLEISPGSVDKKCIIC